jgi:signal transduction histidine kinase
MRQNEKLSALGLLAAEVAHEIRNPLTVLKMLYHSLDLKFAPDDPRARDVEIMGAKMEHLNKIVEQVLDFARTTEPEIVPVNLNGLIEELGLLTRHKLTQQNIHLLHKLEPDLPPALADAAQLEQAFLNLILNAVEAMPDGGRLTIISRRLAPSDGGKPTHVVVEFKDTGHGMTREQRAQAFTSLLKTSKRKGTGLGLAVVARIIETHRGRIDIKSSLGRGTTIAITLPT